MHTDRPNKTSRPAGFFITGTDTEIGKTYAACCLALSFKQRFPDIRIFPRKPIASGAIRRQGKLISEDAELLKYAAGSDETHDQICPYAFEAAISPQRAIQQANQKITISDLTAACQTPAKGLALVEGAGGFYSPLALDGLNKDLAIALNYPVILVVGNRLGCINQTLLTVEAIEAQKLTLVAIIVNDCHSKADVNNYLDITKLAQQPVIHLSYQNEGRLQSINQLDHFFEL